MGEREWYPIKSTYLTIIIFRSFLLAIIMYCMAIGKSIGSNLFIRRDHENDKVKSSCGGVKIKNIIGIIIRMVFPSYLIYQVYGIDWTIYNKVCDQWLFVDMIAMTIEVPFFVFL